MAGKKNKKKKWIILTIILIVVVGVYLWGRSAARKTLNEYAKSSIIESVAKKDTIEVKITENGVIEPLRKNEIYASMGGTVTKEYLQIGEKVDKDESIFKIGGYNIKSPIDGEIIWTNAKEDDYVSAASTGVATPVAVVADMSKAKFTLEIDELDINKVRVDMEVEVTADAVPNKIFKGRVSKINNEGKNTNGVTTYGVEILIDSPEELKIGMNVDCALILENKENTLLIPMASINKEGAETYVYIKEDGHNEEEKMTAVPKNMSEVKGYKKQAVTVGISNKDYIEIVEGLKEGDKVYNISASKSLTEYMVENSGGGMMMRVGN